MTNKKLFSSKVIYSETIDDAHIQIRCKINNITKHIGIYSEFSYIDSRSSKALFSLTTEGIITSIMCRFNKKTDNIEIRTEISQSSSHGFENNRLCSSFLGVHIAERILSYIYPNVKRMPYAHRGYDFICGKGYKVDVKSACYQKRNINTWSFAINKNIISDYFLCLAFDNRHDLEPKHIWLIPGYILNNNMTVSISNSTLKKWKQYEQPLNEIISCCNNIKNK